MAQAITQDDYLKDTSQFDLARKRAGGQYDVNLQNRKDALARRFAQLGNLDSGARLKQEELAANEEGANLTNAREGIDAAQNAEMQRRREILQGQQYGTSEREAGQKFLGEQGAIQRAYGTSERLGSQDFAGGEAQKGRDAEMGRFVMARNDLASQNKIANQQFEKNLATQKEQFMKTYGANQQQFEEARQQFKDTFAEEVRVNNANIDFNNRMLGQKSFMDNLLNFGGAFDGNDPFSKTAKGYLKGSMGPLGPNVGGGIGAAKGLLGGGGGGIF